MKNQAAYIPGVGWRCEVQHRATRRHRSHDYRAVGTYEVTLVAEGRRPLFGTIEGSTHPGHLAPHLVPSVLGRAVVDEELPKITQQYPMVEVWQVCLMPDHLHMILRIKAPLPEGKHLGTVVGAFKGGVSRAWWRLSAADAADTGALPLSASTFVSSPVPAASAAGSRAPLFEPGYNDRILMRDGQLDNWRRYLAENPWRYLFRREHPELMQRVLCITIGGVRYGAFGNMLLLRYPDKHQVFFHRQTGGRPTEQTSYWHQEHDRLTALAEAGDVLVTPGISECEKRIKNEAMRRRLRLIHVQSDPIGPHWKPERSRFEACAGGALLVMAPWQEDLPPFTSDHQRFHYLNGLCESICAVGAGTALTLRCPAADAAGTGAQEAQAGARPAPNTPNAPVPMASAIGPKTHP